MKQSNSFRSMDFWLLGGASLFLWAVLVLAQPFRGLPFIGGHFAQIGTTFALLSLVCNHPHFMISYRIAYGRGFRFLLAHWFSLVVVPVGMIAAFLLAFFSMNTPSFNEPWTKPFNWLLEFLKLGFRFGTAGSLGQEILEASVWVMFLSAGWHYAKQAFGCMMVYAHYDRYSLNHRQRQITKWTLFAVAIFNFVLIGSHSQIYYSDDQPMQMFGIQMMDLGLPGGAASFVGYALVAMILAFLVLVLGAKYRRDRRLPSANFLVPFVAFFVWWVPVLPQREFFFFMVPFFHSLQYLAFAARVEHRSLRVYSEGKFVFRIFLLLLAGAFAFEALPSLLAGGTSTGLESRAAFFALAVPVFINVHHYFLDSVIWKFQDGEVKAALFAEADPRHHYFVPRPQI